MAASKRSGGTSARLLLVGLVVVIVLGVAGAVLRVGRGKDKAPSPEWVWTVLEQSVEACFRSTYEGSREVVLFRGEEEVKRYTQTVQSQGPYQRIVITSPESEQGRTTVRTSEDLREAYPGMGRLIINSSSDSCTCQQWQLEELEHCRQGEVVAVYEGEDTVAGQPCHIIAVRDGKGRLSHRYWIDQSTYVKLKRQYFDDRQRIVWSATFLTIDYAPVFAVGLFTLEPQPGWQVISLESPPRRMTVAEAEKEAGFSAHLPSYMPAGYTLLRDQVAVTEVFGVKIIWLRYSDGADCFSLFEAPVSIADQLVTSASDRFAWRNASHCFVLVGSVTVAELDKLRRSTLEPRL